MKKNQYNTQLLLKNLKLKVFLGATLQEKSKKQIVILNLKIIFTAPPRACKTDNLEDTVCYRKLIGKIKKFCSKQKFNLLEYFADQLFVFIKQQLPKNCKLQLSLQKNPKIKGLEASAFSLVEQ